MRWSDSIADDAGRLSRIDGVIENELPGGRHGAWRDFDIRNDVCVLHGCVRVLREHGAALYE